MRSVPQELAAPVMINPQKLLQSIVDVVCAVDEQGYFQYVSDAAYQLFGYTAKEMTGRSFLNFIHPDDVEKTILVFSEWTQDCSTSNFENRYYKKDGTLLPLVWSGRWDEDDRLLYCVARDGSEKYEVEKRLLKAQQIARVANFEYDVVQDCYSYTSDTLFEIFGLDKTIYPSFTRDLFWQLVHPDDMAMVQAAVLMPQNYHTSRLEYRIVRPDGQVVYINRIREIIRDAKGAPIKTIGTIQDITDRKLGEIAIQQSELKFRSLVQNGNDLIAVIDTEGNYTFIGGNVQDYLGYHADDLIGKNAFEFIHEQDRAWLASLLLDMKNKTTISVGPFRFRCKEGSWRWVTTTATNHLDNPAVGGYVINSKDITEKKLKEDELALSEERFKALVQNGSDLIVIIDENARLTYVSSNVTHVLGYTPEEITGRMVFELIHADDLQKVKTQFTNLLQVGIPNDGVQHRFLHKKGHWVWLDSRGSNHQGNNRIQGILINARNIDERIKLQKRLNRELVNKQREITSAVIKAQEQERSQLGLELHDNVNQILTTVKLYNEMYLSGYVPDKSLLVKSGEYTQVCINEIRSISKRLSAPTLGKISLQDSIKELVHSINLTRRIDITYHPKGIDKFCVPEDLHLAVYRIVQEGLNNILKYSQASMALIEIEKKESELCLTIWDNGIGFDTDAKRQGIGITNMKTRAESLQASFELSSAAGEGCRIQICFPLD